MFAKIENGYIIYPPKHLKENGRYVANYNKHIDDLIADGWLEVIETTPEQREGYYPVAKYEEKDGKIYQTWEYFEANEEEL